MNPATYVGQVAPEGYFCILTKVLSILFKKYVTITFLSE